MLIYRSVLVFDNISMLMGIGRTLICIGLLILIEAFDTIVMLFGNSVDWYRFLDLIF